LTLAELIDIEVQMMRDREQDPAELRSRDRKIGQQLEHQTSNREELFSSWLAQLQPRDHASPGKLFESGYRWLGRFLMVLGLIAGGGTAASVLAFDGTRPVNIVNFLAAIIGIQLITIFFFLLNMLPRFIKKRIPGSGEFYRFIRELSYLFSRLVAKVMEHLPARRLQSLWADLQRMKVTQKLYGSLEKWLAIGLTQRFGLAFNIGALATCLYLISFSDLAFAWNTTLEVSSQSFHRAVQCVAAPWAAVLPQGVPSQELVEATRYFRIDADYIPVPSTTAIPRAILAGRWWLFLILCLVVYGFIPRLIIFVLAKIKIKLALARLPLSAANFESLYDRLTRPLLETRALQHDAGLIEPDAAVALKATPKSRSSRCSVIRWGDIEVDDSQLRSLVQHRFGWQLSRVFSAGSFDYEMSDEATCQALRAQKSRDAILLLAESWEPPQAGLLFFLQQLRNAVGERRHIIVGLINKNSGQQFQAPAPQQWRTWKAKLATLADPFLRVESMVEGT